MNKKNNLFEEKTIETQSVFEGKVIRLQVDKVQLPDGSIGFREIVKHPGAVGVLALFDDRMLVVEQYRKPLERSLVEIPAGKLDPGESLIEAARRELKEETGFDCGSMKPLRSFYTSPGFANEMIHLFVAENLNKGLSRLDDDEFLECRALSLEEAKQYMNEGRIQDAKTVTAVYAWELYKATGQFN